MQKAVKSKKGFTLTELLIGLALIGLLCAIGLPTVFQASSDAHKRLVFKNTIQQLRIAHEQMVSQGIDLKTWAGVDALWARMDVAKVCANRNNTANDCMTIATGDFSTGAVLKNGATLWGFNETAPNHGTDAFWLDYNGKAPPNQFDKDILFIVRCTEECTKPLDLPYLAEPTENGSIVPSQSGWGSFPTTLALWDWIWQ
jgi:prepilin-type N-terminal cleavage/methylation domain-containing protein